MFVIYLASARHFTYNFNKYNIDVLTRYTIRYSHYVNY